LPSAVLGRPLGRTDDLVADLRELGLNVDPLSAAFADLKFEDLTGLVGAVSGGRALPPEVTVGDSPPLGTFREQRRKGDWVALVKRLGCRTKLVDHDRSKYARRRASAGVRRSLSC
jgi:hypothetical protein